MFKAIKRVSESLGLSYPDEHLSRIHKLKRLAEDEMAKVIDEILTKPQRFVNRSESMYLTDALKEALEEERHMLEIEAPFLTFPYATDKQWNGDIDHVDTITGTYCLFTGKDTYTTYGDHLLTKYKGAPQIVPALQKALGHNFNVTMVVDANKSPSSRFILVFRGPIDV